jgi:DNA-binding beta-propeller fold protein YncE
MLAIEAGHTERLGDEARYIFIASRKRPEIVVIDTKIDAVIRRIALPGVPAQILALESGARLAVTDIASKQVFLVDVTGDRVERSIITPIAPRLLQVNRAGSTLAMVDPDVGAVALMSVAGGEIWPIPNINDVRYAVFDPSGRLLLAHGSNVSIVDLAGQTREELVADSAEGPITHLVTDPGGENAFVVQGERGVLSIFELRTRTRAVVLRLATPLGRVFPSADSQFVLVPAGRHTVSIISNWTLRESGRIDVKGKTMSVGLMLFQSVAAIAAEPGQLLLYDLRDRHPVADLRLPGTPAFGAASPDGLKYYVALPDTGQIAVVDLSERPAVRLIGAGVGAWAVVPAMGNDYCH